MRPQPLAAALALATLLGAGAANAAISGVCPDGSIFIVQDRRAIPCRAAKEVAPEEVPPLRPEYLPRPYSWQVYRDSQNPNNPYNLIDAARRVRELQGAPPTPENMASSNANSGISPGFGGRIPAGTARTAQAPQTFAAPPPAPRVPELHLSTDDVRDLFLIVELSQQQAPARFLKEDAQGGLALEVSLAWSDAFDGRFRAAAPEARGPVVLFTVLAHRADAFHPNFTFVQDHDTFRPRIDDPAQMGILEGTLGEIGAEEVVLGYVVLPDRMDPARSWDVYWNDRRIGTVLRP